MSPAARRRLHIGHHFFGSGNFGDDLMLAGFLEIARRALPEVTFACSTPFDRDCQRRRFPAIDWLAYEHSARAASIEACEAWVGVGDTPFQTDVGTWFLDHLIEDAALCRQFRKPMFFVGVGLNNRDALAHPLTRAIVDQAEQIWTRDSQAAELLRQIRDPERISLGADLANVFLATWEPTPVEPHTLAFLLNFEDREAFSTEAIQEIVDATPTYRHRWLIQEVRHLQGSERHIFERLPETVRAQLDVREPDYSMDSIDTFLRRWGTPELLITSRYHGALIGSWAGSRTLIIERNAKLTGLAAQLALPSLSDLRSGADVLARSAGVRPVARHELTALANLATRCGDEFAAALSEMRRTPYGRG